MIKRLVLDVLKPHNPSVVEVSEELSQLNGVEGVNVIIYEIDQKPEFIATDNEIKVLKASLKWINENTEYKVVYPDDFSFAGAGWANHWIFKEFRVPSFCFEILSIDYEPGYEGGGSHNQLVHWMKTTLPVFIYLLVNIENLYNWETPNIQPPLSGGVLPAPLN